MRRTFMYKLYRSKRNRKLHRMINIGGAIYNHAIALHRRYYRLYKKHLSLFRLQAHIAKLKRLPKYTWWAQLPAQAIQDILQRIEQGYQRLARLRRRRVKPFLSASERPQSGQDDSEGWATHVSQDRQGQIVHAEA